MQREEEWMIKWCILNLDKLWIFFADRPKKNKQNRSTLIWLNSTESEFLNHSKFSSIYLCQEWHLAWDDKLRPIDVSFRLQWRPENVTLAYSDDRHCGSNSVSGNQIQRTVPRPAYVKIHAAAQQQVSQQVNTKSGLSTGGTLATKKKKKKKNPEKAGMPVNSHCTFHTDHLAWNYICRVVFHPRQVKAKNTKKPNLEIFKK